MLKFIAVTSAAVLAATPVLAQTATPPAEPAPAAPAQAEPASPAAPAQDAAQPAQAAPAADQVQQIVAAEFPTYDTDKSGDLNETEFQTWVVALRDKDPAAAAKPLDDAGKAKFAKEIFAKADTNKDKKIAQAEMVAFFSGAA
ncbi:hypothetical protein [Pseudonocardia sp. TMWB2A]|uniref:hypothetical protein n=1 Tax=Pseudonocardia sp. TMWB2A TaxID=687430 RepID=UPI00307CDC42